jgi:hypothetical protein
MLEQYGQECEGMWDQSPHMHQLEDLVNPLFSSLDVAFP